MFLPSKQVVELTTSSSTSHKQVVDDTINTAKVNLGTANGFMPKHNKNQALRLDELLTSRQVKTAILHKII